MEVNIRVEDYVHYCAVNSVTHNQAIKIAEDCEFGGYEGWRMSTLAEVKDIIAVNDKVAAIPFIAFHTRVNAVDSVFNTATGEVTPVMPTDKYPFLLVRSRDQYENEFRVSIR